MSAKALILLHPGFEEMEAVGPIDLLTRAGVSVTQAAFGDSLEVPGKNGIVVQARHTFEEAREAAYDCVLMPGGPGVQKVREDPSVARYFAEQHAAGKWVACICAAPLVLKDAGLLEGKRYTAHFNTRGELPDLIDDEAVVADGRLITSRGAGTATQFGLALIERLCGEDKAKEIAESICWNLPVAQ